MSLVKEFLNEARWMYHGSPHDFDKFKVDRNEFMLDRGLGPHFAADPTVARNFANWKEGKPSTSGWTGTPIQGHLYRAKVPSRGKMFKVPQRRRQSDQGAIGAHIGATVMQHHPDIFKDWVMKARNVDEKTANEIHGLLSQGKAPDHDRFGAARSRRGTFRGYMDNFDSGLHMMSSRKGEIIHKYIEHMKSKGYKGISYQNTSPMETIGTRSRKSYIMFDPEDIGPLEKVK